MRNRARLIRTKIARAADRVISRAAVALLDGLDALKVGLQRAWEAHQRHMDERPDYGPQLATLVSVLVALLRVPSWLGQLIARLVDVYLASAGRFSPHQPVGWQYEKFHDDRPW